jgi:hypothetical protein
MKLASDQRWPSAAVAAVATAASEAAAISDNFSMSLLLSSSPCDTRLNEEAGAAAI